MATKARRGFINPYRHYSFVEKDPAIDLARTAVEDSKESYAEISSNSGVSKSTLYNWFHGKTRRPQWCTVAEVLLACGVTEVNLRSLARRKVT